MKPLYYRLDDDNNPIPVDAHDPRFVVLWKGMETRRVALDRVGAYNISTVFLVIDHGWSDEGRPILFETMVFPLNGFQDLHCERYATWDEAVAGHRRIVADVVAERLPRP